MNVFYKIENHELKEVKSNFGFRENDYYKEIFENSSFYFYVFNTINLGKLVVFSFHGFKKKII